ncbi:phosphoglycerate mutase 1 [Lactobacillus hominis DSM 23910 = CRBIP 24.179]|uniref:2,3-bisphosphoglycerate-dependent phosphoglycerate mutase n=1 Tax=Lactobacillus hominis DSM 23910 = CRBIP 24.179 TaxID=1423758 RepID=I7L980_9LACO|nr:phosphoglycerate mutase 1 [Lactobacillus hominis DSM 23910 = CRBIP 24.179]CCI81199.1 2,3-bisphosphoglycerate-dependent phosphoglycerate mutase 1 [Lactobacillus hominis DSM 23910 = CRBIP 24.179]
MVRKVVKLVLVRHGESIANRDNVYTGWNDVALSAKGIQQAKSAGLKVAQISNFAPTHIHTSVLSRAIITANIIADICDFLYLPITKTWRLNERHYGALRGINKDVSRKVFGKEQVLKWRRGFDSVPPLLAQPVQDRRYQNCDMHLMPQGESLHQTQRRLMPYYIDHIAPELLAGRDQLIVAHGSSLRALIKKIEDISDTDIVKLEVPNAQPIVYTFDENLNIVKKEILKND